MTMNMMEQLSAYLDGELDADDVLRLEAEVARNPELAGLLADMKASDDALRAAFAEPIGAAIPDRLMASLGEKETAQVFDIATEREKRTRAQVTPAWFDWRAGAAIAATLVAVLFAGNQYLGPTGVTQDAAQIAFNGALDKMPSGQTSRLGQGRAVSPRLTFTAKDGRFCREYADGTDLGLACRGTEGWKVEAIAKNAASLSGGGGYATAGGPENGLDAAYARLGAGDPLTVADEAKLIARNWSGRP
jgi:hypothetical protein